MGLADVAYFSRRAKFNKGIQNPVYIARIMISPGKQLSVRIRPGTAFTELDI